MTDWYIKHAGAACAFYSITSDTFPSKRPSAEAIDAFIDQFELDNKRKPTDIEINEFKQVYMLTIETSSLTKQ